ncbi:hypothetical protein [Negadavirga shengliensis]|uniref:Uncharacterized protein n=1 Tax=Negadavirga shengliensis TaxID=1389218 RepID=A0ABV9SVS5_9BACT
MINTADFREKKIKNRVYIKLSLDDERKKLANLDKVLFSGGKLYALSPDSLIVIDHLKLDQPVVCLRELD